MSSSTQRETMRVVTDTFAAWKAVRDEMDLLEAKLELHPDTPTPALLQMQSELQELRVKAEALLAQAQLALLAVKTPRLSQVDPTWY